MANHGYAAGNEIQIVHPDQKYRSVDPRSVSVGCFFSKALGRTLGNVCLYRRFMTRKNHIRRLKESRPCHLRKLTLTQVPLDSVGLDELADALQGLAGTASPATSCTIRVRVTGMVSRSRLAELKAKGSDFVDCKFKATGILGQGTGTVQACDLSKNQWSGTTALNFTIQTIDSPINTGAGSSISNTLPVIDDFKAIGTLL